MQVSTLGYSKNSPFFYRPFFKDKTVAEIRQMQDAISDDEYQKIEQEAKYLGAAILMPKADFIARLRSFLDMKREAGAGELSALRYAILQLSMDYNISCFSVALRALDLEQIDTIQFVEYLELIDRKRQ